MGSHSYEVRGLEVYPSDSDDFEHVLWPVFEIRGSEVYPTIHNNRDFYGLPAYEIRDGYAWPTSFNDHDDVGFAISADAGADLSLKEVAAVAAVGVALFAGVKAYFHVKQRRQESLERKAATQHGPTTVLAAPPGWYPTDGGPSYWNGVAWIDAGQPTRMPMYHPAFLAPPAMPLRKNRAVITIAWILAVLSAGYMLPWAIATTRGTSNSTKVGLVSFFLGWTVFGWIAALVMSCTGTRARRFY